MKDLYTLYLIRPDNQEVITVVKLYPACTDADAASQGGAKLMARRNASQLAVKWGRELFEHSKVFTRHEFSGQWLKPIVHIEKEIDL